MNSDVSVIVPTYNRAAYLGQTIDSLLRQTAPPSQLIVVDDGSTDGTAEVVAGYGARVDYVYRTNGGKPAAVNTALSRVTGQCTWVLDDDDVACEDALERLAAALEAHPECAFSYGTYFVTRPTSRHGAMGEVVGESSVPDLTETGLFLALLEGNFLGGARVLVRSDAYREVGGYDERFQRSEDYEMPIRLARRWPGARASGGPVYWYRDHTGPRGHAGDRFDIDENLTKFYQYDALLFDDLFDSLSMSEFLPPGSALARSLRQAHLQRLSLSVIHRVNNRVDEMLQRLASHGDPSPYAPDERAVVDRLVRRIPSLWTPTPVDLVTKIRDTSHAPAIARLRTELALAAMRERLRPPLSPRSLAGTARRAASMYVGGLT